jgi:hypothetical protein
LEGDIETGNAENLGQGTIKGSNCSGNEEVARRVREKTIPTSGEISLFIVAFL